MGSEQANRYPLRVSKLNLVNFRCFSQLSLDFDGKSAVIRGPNGSGKTSILEALHYACYLRSFRCGSPRDLVSFDSSQFSLKVVVDGGGGDVHDILVGVSGDKRIVKIDGRVVRSHKDLITVLNAVSLTDHDLEIIRGYPQIRRSFIDRTLLMCQPELAGMMRDLRSVVDNRNAFLHGRDHDPMVHRVLTNQLWERSKEHSNLRKKLIDQLIKKANKLDEDYFSGRLSLQARYRYASPLKQTFEEFYEQGEPLFKQEFKSGRSGFGSHLDDVVFESFQRKSRQFSSRGQQKLVVTLIKIAKLQYIGQERGILPILMLDDFISDFDGETTKIFAKLLKDLDVQVLITEPEGALDHGIEKALEGKIIELPNLKQ